MKKISINIFDRESVLDAFIEVLRYQDWLTERIDRLCEILAKDYGLKTVAQDYGYTEGGEVTVTAERIPGGWRVRAAGKPVFFLEYGTGTLAGSGPVVGTPPVPTTPGSYSDSEGAGTYSAWIEAGQPGPYPYDHAPKAGMYYAWRAMNENVEKVAREVFK